MLDFWRAYGCFGVGVGVWVKVVLPEREWDEVWCVAGVFFLKVFMEDVEDFVGLRGYFFAIRVLDGGEVGLIHSVEL